MDNASQYKSMEKREAGSKCAKPMLRPHFITDLYYGMKVFLVFLLLHVTDQANFQITYIKGHEW